MANPLRGEVIRLYKNLLYLGREYPKGAAYFRERLKSAFMKNKDETDPQKIQQLVARGDHVIKELEALYFLRKYRTMKKRYYDSENTYHRHGITKCFT
uniref:LYR motif containing 5a n=1 Tax=Nothobranchius furzeri TaxID=105023 RepID=A0A8C6KWJ3_NOTFU